MKTIRLCIGSNDGEIMANTHMGDTECFYIYDLFENGASSFIEKRINTAQKMEHAKITKMNNIIALLEDVAIFVAQQKSKNFMNIARTTKHQPVVVQSEKIPEILTILAQSFETLSGYITQRSAGECFDTIPVLKT